MKLRRLSDALESINDAGVNLWLFLCQASRFRASLQALSIPPKPPIGLAPFSAIGCVYQFQFAPASLPYLSVQKIQFIRRDFCNQVGISRYVSNRFTWHFLTL